MREREVLLLNKKNVEKIKLLHRKCPLCGFNKGIFINTIRTKLPTYVSLASKYDVVACCKCGFTFADTKSTQSDFNDYYSNCNIYSGNAGVKVDLTETLNEIRYTLISKYIAKDKRIVDIGCGSGDLLLYLKQRGYSKLYGIDPSEKSIEELGRKGIHGSVGNIFDETEKKLKRAFDVVICTAVIEHLCQINTFIPHLMDYLKDLKGVIFIDAPDVEGFERYSTQIPNYFNHEHINYFSITSLDNLLKQQKFERINLNEESHCVIDSCPPEMELQGLYKYNSEVESRILEDKKSKISILHYFEQINKENDIKMKEIREFIKRNENIVIWGTGSYTMQLLAILPDLLEHICCFVDNNPTKQDIMFCDKKVRLPQYLIDEAINCPILICSMQNSNDIVNQIKEMKLSNLFLVG